VCTVMGTGEYPPLAERFGVPIVVTGFEPLDILEGIRRAVHQLEEGRAEVENAYARVVLPEGNPVAIRMLEDVFEVVDRSWRGIGMIPQSGWRLSDRYREYDAEERFDVGDIHTQESTVCRSGEVLQGLIKPHECSAFGTLCTPRNPLGATMVSSEGACAAYYLYRRMSVPASGTSGTVPASGTSGTVPASGTSGTVPASGTSGTVPASGTSGTVPASGGPTKEATPVG
jgi:hydrogenase expression/formation protein HypD